MGYTVQPEALHRALDAWMGAHSGVFERHHEPDGVRLVEVASGKPLRLVAEAIESIETRKNWNSGAEYLALQFLEHPPLALADAGFVFALDVTNTGPLEGAPPTMSFRDYRKLFAHLQHRIAEPQTPQTRREALDISLVLIASLDGARAVGLPTQAEEGELDQCIRRLEAGT